MLSVPHLIVIFVVVLVIFGPEKLPELARNFGKVMAEFRRATGDLRSTFEGHMRDLERETEQRRIGVVASTPAPSAAPSAVSPPAIVAAPGIVPTSAPRVPSAAHAEPEAQQPAAPAPALPDPFLYGMDIEQSLAESSAPPAPSEPEPKQDPERVTDGGARPA